MERKRNRSLRGAAITGIAFLAMLTLLMVGLGQVDERSGDAATTAVEASVRRAAVLCYAVEGRYPSNVEELCQKYGLVYDRERYMVVLDAFASNLLPDIYVMPVGGDADE